MKRLMIFGSIVLIALAAAVFVKRGPLKVAWIEYQKPDVEEVSYEETSVSPEAQLDEVPLAEESTVDAEPTDDSTPPSAPVEYNLAVPFTSQAPHGIWDTVHKETCEEASTLMVAFYFDGKPPGKIDPDTAEEELQRLIAFENALFGYHEDTTAQETALVIETDYHLTTELLLNPTVEQLKEAIASGFPVIVPAAGRLLGNPNFTPPGPIYHMLVLKGYTEDGFITNDPGTRLGADYFYKNDVLLNAIHDWNGGAVELGEKIVIVVKPQ